jgi:hypothetical protein
MPLKSTVAVERIVRRRITTTTPEMTEAAVTMRARVVINLLKPVEIVGRAPE